MTRLPRILAALAAASIAVSGLAGCSDSRLGAAAVVDGNVISTDTLQDLTRRYLDVVPDADSGEAQRRILERIIFSRVIDKAARTAHVHARPGEVAGERQALLRQAGGRRGLVRALASQEQPTVLAPSYVDRWFEDRVLYRRLAAKLAGSGDATSSAALNRAGDAVLEAGRSMDIDVNPRYGTWNTRRGLSPLVSGGLSKTAAELNAGK